MRSSVRPTSMSHWLMGPNWPLNMERNTRAETIAGTAHGSRKIDRHTRGALTFLLARSTAWKNPSA
jgi:hypothetical protein